MQLIESKTLGSAQASIEFTNIPQTFTDLLIVVSGRSTRNDSADPIRVWPNGSSANLSSRVLIGQPSSSPTVDSFTDTAGRFGAVPANNVTASTFGNVALYIPNYAGSSNKSFSADSVTENNSSAAFAEIWAGLWSQTTAISSITLDLQIANFDTGSSASLYGITKGSDGTTTVS